MRLSSRLKQHLGSNLWQYLFLGLACAAGIWLGWLHTLDLSAGTRGQLVRLFDEFIRSAGGSERGMEATFMAAFANQLRTVGLIWFLGLTVIGAPLVVGIVFARGYSLGFTIGFLAGEKGRAGLWVILASVLPQNLLYLPLVLAAGVYSVNFSLYLVRGRFRSGPNLVGSLIVYTLIMAGLTAAFGIGAVLETAASPWLLAWLIR